jgi:hypothetical protein
LDLEKMDFRSAWGATLNRNSWRESEREMYSEDRRRMVLRHVIPAGARTT